LEDVPDISWGCDIYRFSRERHFSSELANQFRPPAAENGYRQSRHQRERETSYCYCVLLQECAQLTSQCAQLQDRMMANRMMALTKELASLKLVSDISLEEDDVLKLAFFENNAKDKRYNRHTCQVLGYPKQVGT
ncbi:unnamed protein product, partial [Brassica oleracea var. botrytis]